MSLRQQVAIAKVVESHGKKAVSRAMLEAGYEPKTAKNPKNLTESKAWKDVMEEYYPDKELATVGREGLKATKVVSARITGMDANEQTDDFIDIPDYLTRHKYWETILKMKRYIGPDTQVNQEFTGDLNVAFTTNDTNSKTT